MHDAELVGELLGVRLPTVEPCLVIYVPSDLRLAGREFESRAARQGTSLFEVVERHGLNIATPDFQNAF